MKRTGLILILILALSITPVFALTEPELMDSYGTANANAQFLLKDEHPADQAGKYSALGQSFNADENAKLESVSFVLYKSGSPTWNATAELYAHAGTFGTNGKPTGQPLALSNEFNLTQLNGSTVLYNFQFSYDQQYDLVAGTKYFIVFRNPMGGGVSDTDYPIMLCDATGNHEGNYAYYTLGGWVSTSTADTIFYLYTADQPYIAQETDQFENDAYNWVNVTVRDGAGIANFQTVDIQVNTTGDAETFTHRWTQATGAFSTTVDVDGVTVIDDVRSRTTVIDTNTSIISFRFKIANATSGLCDIITTGTDDLAAATTYTQLLEFRYANIIWNDLYEIVNGGFGIFGILDWMGQAGTFVSAIATHFTTSLIGLATMINLQFMVIWAVFTWFTTWTTRMITNALAFGTAMRNIMNGVTFGVGDIWSDFNFSDWGPDLLPVFLTVHWINTVNRRAKTQGLFTVLNGDLNAFANVFAFFMGAFSTLIGYIESKVGVLTNYLSL